MIRAKLLLETACLSNHADIQKLRVSGFGTRELPTTGTDNLNASKTQTDTDTSHQSTLFLLDEETVFLCQKGELVVAIDTGSSDFTNIDIDTLWKIFCKKNSNFPTKYAVYSYFKAKNYIVRTGINFGVDYCVYHALPSVCHSEMCITVMDAWSSGRTCSDLSNITATDATSSSSSMVWQDQTSAARLDKLSWRHVTTLTRVIPDVMKLCVICYVMPASWSQANRNSQLSERAAYLSRLFPDRTAPYSIDSSTPVCLDQLQVHCVTALVRRLPAPSATYQSIGQIQAVYQKSSTAQKKKENKAALKKQHQQQRLAAVVASVTKQRASMSSQACISKSTASSADGSAVLNGRANAMLNTVSASTTAEPGPGVFNQPKLNTQAAITLSTTATVPTDACSSSSTSSLTEQQLSARQKRVAKFLLKAQKQQSGAERRERRDHHESRGKVLSQKNQRLLQLMEVQDRSEGVGRAVVAAALSVSTATTTSADGNSTTAATTTEAIQSAETTRVPLTTTSANSMDSVGLAACAQLQSPAISADCIGSVSSTTDAATGEGPSLKRKFCDSNSVSNAQSSSTVQTEAAKRPRLSLSGFSCSIL